jgi:hypothetical protein
MTTAEQHEQRMNALAAANALRTYRAKLKRAIARGDVDPRDPLEDRDENLDSMLVEDYLTSVPGIGWARAREARKLGLCGAGTTVGELTDRQRMELMTWLRAHVKDNAKYRRATERAMA